MKRRSFLAGATTGAAISVLDWLGYFRRFGVPGTAKTLGLAEAAAQALAPNPRFLVYWFQEGGWDGYSMFNPVHTANDADRTYAPGTLNPSPPWSSQIYRPKGYGTAPLNPPQSAGPIRYGYLAEDGKSLFNDMAVVSSHYGNTFHSGGRWEYHYGKYGYSLSAERKADERTVMQAFCEAYGASYVLPHVSWHRWLSDGELSIPSFPEGTGYYDKLGPAYAHTVYGRTPTEMRARLASLSQVTATARQQKINAFLDDANANFLRGREGESIRSFDAAVKIHKTLTGGGVDIDASKLFTNATLRSEFGITAQDEQTSQGEINGNPARSKECPNTNVQAMMAYELMTQGLSIAFWIESRDLRRFDTHISRGDGGYSILSRKGQPDQLDMMRKNLWTPLKTFVAKLKATPYGTSGKSYYDYTTIVLASEMGRTINGDVEAILQSADSDAVKYQKIMEQDCCQHWKVSSAAFLGGTVRGNSQWGRVGGSTLEPIPILANGALDPAYDADTGQLKGTKSAQSFVTDAGHVYSTALHLSGLDPSALRGQGKGRNDRPPLAFIKK